MDIFGWIKVYKFLEELFYEVKFSLYEVVVGYDFF